MNQSGRSLLFDQPARYRIRVLGRLNVSWSTRMGDMAIAVHQSAHHQPVSTLTGEIRDQAGLMGLLSALYDMGYPLLRVERLDALPSVEQPLTNNIS